MKSTYRIGTAIFPAAVILTASVASLLTADAQKTKGAKATTKAVAAPSGGADAITLGKSVYAKNGCATCHAIGGKGGASGPDLSNTGANPSHTADWFKIQVANPKKNNPNGVMPGFADKIKGAELAGVAAYMVSLKTGGAAAPSSKGYVPTGAIRSWAYTTNQAPTEDHVNVDLAQNDKKVVTGQLVIRVESTGKMFAAVNLPPMNKRALLGGVTPENTAQLAGKFFVVWSGGKAVVDAEGKYSPDGKAWQPAHIKLTLLGIGSLTNEGNPEGEMKLSYTVTGAAKQVLWKVDLKKVANGYVHVEAPGK